MKYFSPDKEFKNIALNIGTSLIIFLVAFDVLFYGFYYSIAARLPSNTAGEIVSEILYGITYLAVFIIPALIYRAIAKKTDLHPLRLTKTFKPSAFPYLFLAIAAGFSCSYASSFFFSVLNLPESLYPSSSPAEAMTFVQFLLAAFTTAIVPAICEEFLFRSTILENLIPYGKGFAIITSALLFGLMHQTFFQFLYTTVAGIILGWAYYKTRSYLCVFLIHFSNNFIGVLEDLFVSNLHEELASFLCFFMEAVIFALGILSVIIIAINEKKKKDIYAEGSFGKILESSDDHKEKKISFYAPKTFFRSPTVIIYVILTLISIFIPLVVAFV